MSSFREKAEGCTREAVALRKKAAALLESAEAADNVSEEVEADVRDLLSEAQGLEKKAEKYEGWAKTSDANADAISGASAPVARATSPDAPGGADLDITSTFTVTPGFAKDPKCGFASIGEFAATVHSAGPQEMWSVDDRLAFLAAAGSGLEQGTSSLGGAAVPPSFSTMIWDGAMARSNSLLSFCDRVAIDAGAESVSFPATDETSRVDGSRAGGIQGYWKGELTQMSASKPKLREVRFEPQELYVFSYVSDKLLRRPVALSSWLSGKAVDELSFKIGDAIYNGDGVGKPKGLMNSSAVVTVAKETAQTAATINKANIDKMYARLHSNYRNGAVWFINQDAESQVLGLADSGGNSLITPPGGISGSPTWRIYNLPVIPIEYAATLGTVGDIMLANLDAYGACVRGLVDQSVSMHLKFDYAQSAFRWIFEIDGQPWLESAITPFKGSNTLSPFVNLATRA